MRPLTMIKRLCDDKLDRLTFLDVYEYEYTIRGTAIKHILSILDEVKKLKLLLEHIKSDCERLRNEKEAFIQLLLIGELEKLLEEIN